MFLYLWIVYIVFLQKFLLQGRLIFGPDVRSLFLTIFLIVAPVAVFCIFVARKLMDDFPHSSGVPIFLVVVVFTVYVSSLSLSLSLTSCGFSFLFLFLFFTSSPLGLLVLLNHYFKGVNLFKPCVDSCQSQV